VWACGSAVGGGIVAQWVKDDLMYSGKRLKHTETVPFWACITAVTVVLGSGRSTAVSVSVCCGGTGGCWGLPAVVSVGLRHYASNVGSG